MANQNSINAPTPINVSNGGSGLSSQVAYSVLTGGTSSTGALQNLASIGSVGQAVKSVGASALPIMNGHGYVLITTLTASNSASLIVTTGFSSAYSQYMIVVNNIIPATNNAILQMQYSTDGGSTYITTLNSSACIVAAYNANTYTTAATNNTSVSLSNAISNTGGNAEGVNGIHFQGYVGSNTTQQLMGLFVSSAAGMGMSCASYGPNTALNANTIKFFMSSGNITSGTIYLYGTTT